MNRMFFGVKSQGFRKIHHQAAGTPTDSSPSQLALKRLQQGFALGNQSLFHDQTHGR
jgi:hypothetical protein